MAAIYQNIWSVKIRPEIKSMLSFSTWIVVCTRFIYKHQYWASKLAKVIRPYEKVLKYCVEWVPSFCSSFILEFSLFPEFRRSVCCFQPSVAYKMLLIKKSASRKKCAHFIGHLKIWTVNQHWQHTNTIKDKFYKFLT